MVHQWARSTPVTVALILALLFAAWPPAASHAQSAPAAPAVAAKQLAAAHSVFLPLVVKAASGSVIITSPPSGAEISGTTYVAAQPVTPGSITSVSFKADSVDLGTDTTPADGFKVFLDVRTLPEGPVTLTATATGANGTDTQAITVNAVPNPPSSRVVDAGGAVLASEIGSVITVPPGAVLAGTNITVDEKTQQEVTDATGFNWDALGVTFLGAQTLQTSAPINQPLGVDSAGFGPRVQPGQAVVNYRILPDADGDGVGELVAVNTASVAPTNDVISDPVPQIAINSVQMQTPAGLSTNLSSPPGTRIIISGNGFNALSSQGNVAIFHSLVNNANVQLPLFIQSDDNGAGKQTATTLLPALPTGPALITLRNESTGFSTTPLALTITAATALSGSAPAIIDQAITASIKRLNQLASLGPEPWVSAQITKSIDQLNAVRTYFQQISANPTPDQQQLISAFATLIENSNVLSAQVQKTSPTIQACDLAALKDIATGLGIFSATLLALAALPVTAPALLVGAGLFLGGAAGGFFTGSGISQCLTPPCDASMMGGGNGGGASTTGMGSAPPSGGSGCGNVAGGGSGVQSLGAHIASDIPARYTVKIFPRGGTGSTLTPFTGATDPGGYFFIPIIPEGQPFTAVAVDQVTGALQTFDGVGPPMGQSVYMAFDFSNAKGNRYNITIGDTVSNGVPGTGAGNIEQAGALDIYTFSATPGQQIFVDAIGVDAALTYVHWKLVAPDGSVLFNSILNCCGGEDQGVITLAQAGIYTLRVGGDSNPGTGVYGFKLWNVPPPQQFGIAIGDTVSNGVPGAGAGNIESPGVKDIYTFTGTAGQQIFVDVSGADPNLTLVGWKMLAPDGSEVFNTIFNSGGGTDPGVVTLPQSGTYTIIAGDDANAGTGVYAFKLWDVPPPQQFSIALGDTVSNGVPGPGAGNIESPGVKDVYTFTANAGQHVYVDVLAADASLTLVRWKLLAPDGSEVFNTIFNCCGGSDPGAFTLPQSGTYTVIAGDDKESATGVYSFQIRAQ